MIVKSHTLPPKDLKAFAQNVRDTLNLNRAQYKEIRRSLTFGAALLDVDPRGVILGGVGFYVGELNTDRVLCETLLYVRVWARGGAVAKALVAAMEEEARLYNCTAILAGSSLHNHSHTTRIYEDAGFTTNLTFRKELTYV